MNNLKEDGTLADFYQNTIAISRYARWDENKGRREVYSETVDRLINFFQEDLTERVEYDVSKKKLEEVRESILAQDVMPSMRALMTAGPALKRNHIAAYNPVSGDTPVLTKEYGMVNIESIAGQDVTVVNKDGRWSEAKINHHGQQELRAVELKRTGSSVTVTVKATPDHRWYKTDGEVVSTANLKPGDLIPSATAPRPATDNIDYELGLLHGLIYGDGTTTYSQERVSGYHIRLCGTSRQLAGLFAEHGKICYPPSANGDPVVQMYGAFAKTHGLKDLPDEDESLEYILGFIRGWLAADGSVAKEREATLCLNEDNIEWFKRNSPRVGILYNGTQELNPVTNFGDRKKRAFSIRLDRNSLVEEDFIIPEKRERFAKSRDYDYRVVSVSNLELVDDVYCASVPDTNTFVLSHGIVTGNCSFIPVDTLRAFDETLLVLMQGTGLGFSVESKNVRKLPEVAESFHNSDTVIKVGDSKEGWAKSYKELIAMVWSGNVPQWDTSAVRPAGARLKTFGGRASGPEPLEQLFKHTIAVVKGAAGRKLKPIEAHSIMCKIAEVVVVGGVRRSALISLSDLDDYEMGRAKSGAWWETSGHFGLANNSAVYTVKPSVEHFMAEWISLIESKSGERGIFNLHAAQLLTERSGRRDSSLITGTNPCSEINLRDNEFCNLTEVIVKSGDSLDELKRKVELATILGTWQSTLTDIKYLRKVWKNNIEEERLLGVSLTGQFGHKVLNGSEGMDKLAEWLEILRDHAIEVNKKEARKIGIPQSAAITCVKPSGTVSQLCGVSSGMHPWHSEFYIRTIRGDNKDPLTQFMKDQGIPHEPDVMNPNNTTVFSFPIKAPEGAVTREDINAIQHLELWLAYQRHWCEHKPSVTISVRDEEWFEVGAWVYKNFDEVSGVSFLPHSDHTYRQAPYQEATEQEYLEALEKMPKNIDWTDMEFYEQEDTTTGSQELACSAGACDVADLSGVSDDTDTITDSSLELVS